MTTDTKPPARIFPQCHDEDGEPLRLDEDDITWCQDQIRETDVQYVRADIVDALIDALEIAKEEIEFLGGITKSLDIARAALAQAKG
jgi:hypothetical protein